MCLYTLMNVSLFSSPNCSVHVCSVRWDGTIWAAVPDICFDRALICHDGLCICTGHWVSDVQNPLHAAECRHAAHWTTQAAGCHSELDEDDHISVTAAYHDLIVATVQWPFGACHCHMREANHVPTYNRLPCVLFVLVFLFNLCLQCLAVLVWWQDICLCNNPK